MNRLAHTGQDPRQEAGKVVPMTENTATKTVKAPALPLPHLQLGVLGVGVVLAAAVVIWLLLGSNRAGTTIPAPSSGPTLVSQQQLERLAGSVDHPVYWAGTKNGFSYELTRTADGRIFIRYLPQGVQAGDRRPNFLAVGTYPRSDAFADLKTAAKRKGAVSLKIATDGLVVFNTNKPTSVYFGYPNARYQVEVFAPSGETARSLVLTGRIKPVK